MVCVNCGALIADDPRLAGQFIACPQCRGTMTVPDEFVPPTELHPVIEVRVTTPGASHRREPRNPLTSPAGVCLLILFIAVVVFGVTVAVFEYQAFRVKQEFKSLIRDAFQK